MTMTRPTQQLRNYSLDFMRILSIIAVIIIHCIAIIVIEKPVNSSAWMAGNLMDSFARWSVPVFVMISGALLIKKSSFLNARTFIQKKLTHILVPIIIWPLVYVAWNYAFFNVPPNLLTIVNEYASGSPAPGHLYFLFLIAGLYALTPLISLLALSVSRKHFILTTIIVVSATATWHLITSFMPGHEQNLNIITRSFPYIGYYMLGYALKDIKMPKKYPPYSLFIASGLIMTGSTYFLSSHFPLTTGLAFYEYPSIITVLLAISAYLSGISLYRWIKSKLQPKSIGLFNSSLELLSSATFGVYLLHMIIINIIVRYSGLHLSSIKEALIIIILTIILSYAASITLSRLPYLRLLVK